MAHIPQYVSKERVSTEAPAVMQRSEKLAGTVDPGLFENKVAEQASKDLIALGEKMVKVENANDKSKAEIMHTQGQLAFAEEVTKDPSKFKDYDSYMTKLDDAAAKNFRNREAREAFKQEIGLRNIIHKNGLQKIVFQKEAEALTVTTNQDLDLLAQDVSLSEEDFKKQSLLKTQSAKESGAMSEGKIQEAIIESSYKHKMNIVRRDIRVNPESTRENLQSGKYPGLKEADRNTLIRETQSMKRALEYQATEEKTSQRFDIIGNIANGKFEWKSSLDLASQIAIQDPELGEAILKVSGNQGMYQAAKDENIEYQDIANNIFKSKSRESIGNYLIEALTANGGDKISSDRLAILVNAATLRAKELPLRDKDSKIINNQGLGLLNPIDVSFKAIMSLFKTTGSKDNAIIDKYLLGISREKDPKEVEREITKDVVNQQLSNINSEEMINVIRKSDGAKGRMLKRDYSSDKYTLLK